MNSEVQMSAEPIIISRGKVMKILVGVASLLVLMNLLMLYFQFGMGRPNVFGLVRLFNLDGEGNLPSFFSAIILMLAGIMLALIARLRFSVGCRYRLHWAGLAALFLLMSVDEAAGLHELMIYPVRRLLDLETMGLFYFAWVLPAIVFLLVFGVAYINFWRQLESRTRWLFCVSGVLFMGGALGIEMFEARWFEQHSLDLVYSLFVAVEEFCEMAGILLFVYALMGYFADLSQGRSTGIRVVR